MLLKTSFSEKFRNDGHFWLFLTHFYISIRRKSSSEKISVGCSLHLRVTVSTAWSENFFGFAILSITAWLSMILFSYFRVRPSNRDAVLTVSPMTVASIRRLVPIVPTITSPVFIPIPMFIFFQMLDIWNRLMKSCISMAQMSALSECSCSKIIMIPSPRNLSINPP